MRLFSLFYSLVCMTYFILTVNLISIIESLSPSDDNNPVVQICLIGDSLFFKPTHMWNLLQKIQDRVPGFNLNISVHARNSNTIRRIRDSQLGPCLAGRPQIVLMLWDSDVSNVDETQLTNQQINWTRGNYTIDLEYVIQQIISSGAYMAVGGPILLGEGYFLRIPIWYTKNTMLDQYLQINECVTKYLGVDYVDVRGTFMSRIPFFWSLFMGSLTIDGEHPNYAGAELIASLYAQKIRNFLNAQPYQYIALSNSLNQKLINPKPVNLTAYDAKCLQAIHPYPPY